MHSATLQSTDEINLQKTNAFLLLAINSLKIKLRKQFTLNSIIKIKYLRVHLAKEVHTYTLKTTKTLIKEWISVYSEQLRSSWESRNSRVPKREDAGDNRDWCPQDQCSVAIEWGIAPILQNKMSVVTWLQIWAHFLSLFPQPSLKFRDLCIVLSIHSIRSELVSVFCVCVWPWLV